MKDLESSVSSVGQTRSSVLTGVVAAALAPSGPLARVTEGFQSRAGQAEMALAVARVVEHGGVLVVEAATGVGKTFAYLVPALLSGERVLISTATKALQDQLFGRDLPRLAEALGLPVRMALLKGRASYLCRHRLDLAVQDAGRLDRRLRAELAKVERWARGTRNGDMAELAGLDERSPIMPLVTSTRENCLGADCPHFRDCFVNQARREAMAADVVVINHHLFFADLAIRESGMAELLPSVRVAVFDEAHQLNETGIQFLGEQLGSGQLLDLARDLLAAGLRDARGMADWNALAGRLEQAARELRLSAGPGRAHTRLRWVDDTPEGVDPGAWQAALQATGLVLAEASKVLAALGEPSPDLRRLHERSGLMSARVAHFGLAVPAGHVRWVEVGAAVRLRESPLDIAEAVRTRMLGSEAGEPAPRPPTERARAWVFVSATLGDDARLSWFTQPCGLDHARVLRIGSPFDYPNQAALYVPREFARPGDAAHSPQVAQLAGDAAERLGGRTMVLTTTLRALREIGRLLGERFGAGAAIEVLVQGQWPKRMLMERFRAAGQGPGRGCILVASASFWEGVDLPGDALQLVVIDKLPFPPPGDPLVEARCRAIEAAGRSAFADYSVPEAAVALKQGAGRLIRSESDRGVLAICDQRLVTMGYGQRLLAALPPMRRLASQGEFEAALDGLPA